MKPLCYIKWRDAQFEQADEGGTVDPSLMELDELGWLVGETEDVVTICLELEPNSEGVPSSLAGRSRLHIPKVNIVEMRVQENFRKAFPRTTVRTS